MKRFPSVLAVLVAFAALCFSQTKHLTMESIFAEGGITGRAPEGFQWSPDGSKVSFVQRDDSGEHGELWYLDVATGKKAVLVSEVKLASLAPPLEKVTNEREKERLARYSVAAYHWAPDSKHLLFDSHGQLWLYNLENGVGVQFTSAREASGDPKFSPNGKAVSFIRAHNLYVRSMDGEHETQLTSDKDENILNGEPDWVYTEELGVRSNYFWSPDGKQIVFLQMDETKVPVYPLVDMLGSHAKVDNQKYPQVGDPNPVVRVGVVNADGGKVKWIAPLASDAEYIPRFGWVRNGLLWMQTLNRAQNRLDLYFVDAKSGVSHRTLSENSDAWMNVTDDFRILKSGDTFLWSSWRDGRNELYLYSFNEKNPLAEDARLERQITKEPFLLTSVEGVDEKSGAVYMIGHEDDPRLEHLFSVKLDGTSLTALTKNLREQIWFSDDAKFFITRSSSAMNPPRVDAMPVGQPGWPIWESRKVEEYGLAQPKNMEFKAEDGTKMYGSLILPENVSGKVPLIVYVYGGPAGQTVEEGWGGTTFLFHQLLVKRGFAVFTVDNRGTPNREKKFQAALKGQFGAIELRDQLTALDQLLAQYPQLDKDRVAIWGWSNGGSMTLYAMTHSDRFRAGVAVAPVTDQRNYDSIYTERYMGLLKDNAAGYEGSNISKAAGQLRGSLLLVHGTGDDNVHPQNSIQFVDALYKAGKQFRLMLYPNKTHGISGPAARTHLFHMIEEHLERELMGK